MNEIDELLARGVDKIYPSKEDLEKILKSGKKLKLYQGFDPTGSQLHIGHMVGLRKLSQFQKAGHHVIFLIGDFTGMVGDPTGKESARKPLTREEVSENAKNYKKQVSEILKFDGENPVEIRYNSEWLGKLSAIEFTQISHYFTFNQIIERDMFQERLKKHDSVGLVELTYPVMQAYDSVAMDVDLEIGGTDQTFNMLMGRQLMKSMKNKDKFVLTTPLLTDSAGNKIGKTEGNVIALTDKPEDLYRKIMALGDDVIVNGLEYLTDVPMQEINEISNKLEAGENPINFKKRLAFEITKQLNSNESSKKAEEEFGRVVQNRELPDELPERKSNTDRIIDEDLLTELDLASSRSNAKRLFEQDSVRLDGNKIKSGQEKVSNNSVLSVGKKMVRLIT